MPPGWADQARLEGFSGKSKVVPYYPGCPLQVISEAESWLPLDGRLKNHSKVTGDPPPPSPPTVPDLLGRSCSINQYVLEGVC